MFTDQGRATVVDGPVAAVREPETVRVPASSRELLGWMDRVRMEAGLSAAELGRRMGVTPQTIQEYREYRRGERIGLWFVQRWLSVCGLELRAKRVD